MPTLKQIKCSIELGHGNAVLPEYRVRYGDGKVKCRVATPEEDELPFNIHVVATGYIAPGLACHVFIDGELQCTRNAPCVIKEQSDPSTAQTEFRLRQHESPYGEGTFVGREWSFTKLRRAKDSTYGNKRFDKRVGTIEVIVLRCRYEDVDFNAVPRRLGKAADQTLARPPQPANETQHEGGKKITNEQNDTQANNEKPKQEIQQVPTKAASTKSAKSDKTVASVEHVFGTDGASDDHMLAVDGTMARSQGHGVWKRRILCYDGSNDSSTSSISVDVEKSFSKKDTASVSGFSTQSYWQISQQSTQERARGGRPTLIFPALPVPMVSADCKPDTDRAVQIGAGALYAHETRRPVYIDKEDSPYAVFKYEYCSPKTLAKHIGHEVGSEYHSVVEQAAKGQLEGMSKNRLVEELLKKRRNNQKPARSPSSVQFPTPFQHTDHDQKSDQQSHTSSEHKSAAKDQEQAWPSSSEQPKVNWDQTVVPAEPIDDKKPPQEGKADIGKGGYLW